MTIQHISRNEEDSTLFIELQRHDEMENVLVISPILVIQTQKYLYVFSKVF